MTAHGSTFGIPVYAIYSVDETDANLFTKCGSPTLPVIVFCYINAGVALSASSTSTKGLRVPAFPAGTRIIIRVLGFIHGHGGRGGDGGDAPLGNGQNGFLGGTALELFHDVSIDNGNGEIFAGGSGGDGGDAGGTGGGGGGGGGQGADTALGGDGGHRFMAGVVGDNGQVGNVAGNGNGGLGGAPDGANGKVGRTWGNHVGGAAPKAIDTNGFTVTWISGNDPLHVKGDVS